MSEENKNTEQNELFEKNSQSAENGCSNEGDVVGQETVLQSEVNDEDTPIIKQKKKIKISLKTYIISTVAIILATLMTTYAACSGVYKKKYGHAFAGDQNGVQSGDVTENGNYSEIDVIDLLMGTYFYGDVEKGKMTAESLKAYVAATGDIYAAYYTQEELDAMTAEDAGKMQGIGVTVINSTVTIDGVTMAVMKITNVSKNSPAQEAGVKVGDMIAYVGKDNPESVTKLGYDEALRRLRGLSGTVAEFTVLRKNGESYESVFITATRREVTTVSVFGRVSTLDPKIGIVNISSFDYTTPTQFKESIEELKTAGCDKFVLDVRGNPGGALISVAAVLSYFLDEGDVYIRTEDKNGNVTSNVVGVVSNYTGDYAGCNVAKEEIGMYKDLNMAVICNEYTASAGELFTASFRDYGLGKIVGTTTFGKGKMQTTYMLARFGLEGAVKFTTHMYYSAKSEGYDGIGIKPDAGCEVELSEEAKTYNIYDLPDEKDNQLLEAIKHFK